MKNLKIALLLFFASFVNAQTATENYIKTTTYQEKTNIVVPVPDFQTNLSGAELFSGPINGGGSVVMSNNTLTISISGSGSAGGFMKTGIIKALGANPPLPDATFPVIYSAGAGSLPTGYTVKIVDNKLVIVSSHVLTGFLPSTLTAATTWTGNYPSTSVSPVYFCNGGGGGGASGNLKIVDGLISYTFSGSWSNSCNIKTGRLLYLNTTAIPQAELGRIRNSSGELTDYGVRIKDNYLEVYSVVPEPPTSYSYSVRRTITELFNPQKKLVDITYTDGLGRPKQNIAISRGGDAEDIATAISYDNFGRADKDYLPYAGTTINEAIFPNLETSTLSFYNTPKYEHTLNPFSIKKYENSPQNRVIEQGAPGNAWNIGTATDNNHSVRVTYGVNIENEVREYRQVFAGTKETPEFNYVGFYKQKILWKTVTKNENWQPSDIDNNTVQEFTDFYGNMILRRAFNAGQQHDTYYVYDLFGNLTYVIPPAACDLFNARGLDITNLEKTEVLTGLCYSYRYDLKNRQIEKRLPGQEWEYIVYDKTDRPMLVQNANLAAQNKWLYTKYDAFNRVIYTGEFVYVSPVGNTGSALRKELQNYVNTLTVFNESKSATGFTDGGITINYTNVVFPVKTAENQLTVFSVNYYDNYDFKPWGTTITVPATTVYTTAITTKVQSLGTGSIIRILGTNHWITNLSFYDAKARIVYSKSDNSYLGTSDTKASKLNFTGLVLNTTSTHSKTGGLTNLTILDNFTYDQANRLLRHTQKVGSNGEELIVYNKYDELGKLIQKKVGGKVSVTLANTAYDLVNPLQKVDYTYNARGWLKSMNDPELAFTKQLFGFKLNYDSPQLGASALYNGNISESSWKTGDSKKRNYLYGYDKLNRLTDATYLGNYTFANGQPENFTERVTEYDKNGNIVKLERYGIKQGNLTGLIDNLTYGYTPKTNSLLKVDDAADRSNGFLDRNVNTVDYAYDNSGNMISDKNKSITKIEYNHMGLPVKIVFRGADPDTSPSPTGIKFIYDATGTKIAKQVLTSKADLDGTITIITNTTQYNGGYIYANDVLQYIKHPEGYISYSANAYTYVYQYTDHLGNVRLSYKDANADNSIATTEILEESHYYPFGVKHRGYNNVVNNIGNSIAQKYKYNGKEYQDELSLDLYDYGARNYDPAIGRWLNIDPLAEKSRRFSPYTYAMNNPVFYIDPDGKQSLDHFYFNTKGELTRREVNNNPDKFYVAVAGTEKTKYNIIPVFGKNIVLSEQTAKYNEIKLDSDLGHMIRAVYAEAAGQSKEAKVALAEVIRNRADDTTKPSASNNYNAQFSKVSTYKGVISQPSQFESYGSKSDKYVDPMSVTGGDKNGKRNILETNAFSDSVGASIKATMQNTDTVQGATYFYSPYISAPNWINNMEQITVPGVSSGDFRFYRY